MRNRGACFWAWTDTRLQTRTHDEQLDDGTEIDVQVRISRTGGIQMFLGVYQQEGIVLAEEVYENLPGQTVARALVYGTKRARAIAMGRKLPTRIAGSA